MADPSREHRRPHPQSMAAQYLEFDITRELEQLQHEPGWQSGQNAKRWTSGSRMTWKRSKTARFS